MKIKTICSLVLLLAASFASAQQVTRCGGPNTALYINWPMPQFDVCLTGYNPYETQIGKDNVQNLELTWRQFNDTSSSVLVNGTLYYVSSFDEMAALDAHDGTNRWRYPIGGIVSAIPVVAKGILYVGSQNNNFFALDATTGALTWQYTASSPITDAATVENGVVYVTDEGQKLYALNAKTGALLWQKSYSAGYAGPAAVVNGLLYIANNPGAQTYAFNAVTGALVWVVGTAQTGQSYSPTVINGTVYIARQGDIYALAATSGQTLWHVFVNGERFTSSTAVASGIVYVGAEHGVYALDGETGSQMFRTDMPASISFLSVANGVLYATTSDGNLHALDATAGQMLWSYPLDRPYSATVANGGLYLGASVLHLSTGD